MRVKPSSYFLILIILSMAVIIRSLITMPYWECKLLPLIVGGIALCLAVVELWREIRSKDKRPELTGEGQPEIKDASSRLGYAIGWVVGSTLGVYLLGFLVGIALFILSYLKLSRRSWKVSVVAAAIITGLIYGIFELALGVELYRGLIYSKITSG